MKNTKLIGSGSLIISYDFTNGKDNSVLLVGEKQPRGAVKVINAFQGKEAEDLYLQLITKREEK